jgi:ketosteroid isomerase-like protein
VSSVSKREPIEIVRELNGTLDGVDHVALRDAAERTESLADLRGGPFEWLVDKVESLVAADCRVEWIGQTTAMVEGSEFASREEWMRLWRQWLSAWEVYELDDENYAVFGDQVVVDVTHRGRGRESGIELELPQAQLWTVRNGVLTRLRVFEDREAAERVAAAEQAQPG